MEKKIIFFDGDGTLWYPKKTKHTKEPWWIYTLPGDHHIRNSHLIMTPTALQTIKKLKKKGILTVILSTHPHTAKEAKVIINHKIEKFKLHGLFDEVHATRAYPASKGEFIIRILRKRKIPKSKALMVGDMYEWDYRTARSVGVDALLIDSAYWKKHHPYAPRVKRVIKKLSDLFKYL